MHTLGTAAKATGLNKSTVLRAIKSGKISAAKDEHGEWQIDAAELHRVYPPVADAPRRISAEQRHATLGAAEAASLLEAQIASLKDVAALMREQLDDVRKDRDAWRSQAEGNQRLLTAAKPRGGVLSRLFGRAA
jgi:excisionase family DNA binding protein